MKVMQLVGSMVIYCKCTVKYFTVYIFPNVRECCIIAGSQDTILLCRRFLNGSPGDKKRSPTSRQLQIFPQRVCVQQKPTATRAERITVITLVPYEMAQDASLTLSRTSLGLTLLLPVVTPVVTEAMICQSVFISSCGHVLFA